MPEETRIFQIGSISWADNLPVPRLYVKILDWHERHSLGMNSVSLKDGQPAVSLKGQCSVITTYFNAVYAEVLRKQSLDDWLKTGSDPGPAKECLRVTNQHHLVNHPFLVILLALQSREVNIRLHGMFGTLYTWLHASYFPDLFL